MAVMEASRKLMAELASMVNKKVRVILKNDRWYEGELLGFDHPELNMLLGDATDNAGNKHRRVIIKGDNISEIIEVGIPIFDPEDFREYLIREMGLKEHQVKVIPEAGIVEVQKRYKISERGVEGSGPVAEILSQYFNQYIKQRKKMIQG